jgi:hypothetical protein
VSSYVVYFNPPDFPGRFVVREWFIGRSGELLALNLIGTAPFARRSPRPHPGRAW